MARLGEKATAQAKNERKEEQSSRPINQPLQNGSELHQSLEEKNLQRQLSNILNNLTKSQLNILQNGSPTTRQRERQQRVSYTSLANLSNFKRIK